MIAECSHLRAKIAGGEVSEEYRPSERIACELLFRQNCSERVEDLEMITRSEGTQEDQSIVAKIYHLEYTI